MFPHPHLTKAGCATNSKPEIELGNGIEPATSHYTNMLYRYAGSRQVHLVSHFNFIEEQCAFEKSPCLAAESYYAAI